MNVSVSVSTYLMGIALVWNDKLQAFSSFVVEELW